MCDRTGASVAAQPIVPERESAHIDVLPCEAVLAFLVGQFAELLSEARLAVSRGAPPLPLEARAELGRFEAVRVSPATLPPRLDAQLLLTPLVAGLQASSGHRLGIYRPPLGRA